MEKSDLKRIPLSKNFLRAWVLIHGVLLTACFYLLDITWVNTAYSVAFATGLIVVGYIGRRGRPRANFRWVPTAILEAPLKHTFLHLLVILLLSFGLGAFLNRFPRLSEAAVAISQSLVTQVWPLLGFVLAGFVFSLHDLLRGPAQPEQGQ